MEHLIDIPGRLHSVAVEKHIAGTDQIYDDILKTTQDILNLENITDVKVQEGKLQFLNIQGQVLKEISIAFGQKQSDWNQTDSTQVDFIKNRPTVYNKQEVDDKLITKQDIIDDIATIRSNAQAGATAYHKPQTGIPATDLASAVQTSLSKADTALQEHQSLAGLVNTGNYNTVSKKIELKHDNTVLAEIDATTFIKDGMVSSVTISNGYLIITFNTDAGKEPISIALTDIFNPANYYTKSQVDNALSDKLDDSGNNYGVYNGVLKISGLQDQDGNDYIRNGMHLPQGLEIYYYNYKTTITGEDIVVHSKGEPEDGSVSLRALAREVDGKANTSDLSEVATSGSYNDLADTPIIPDITGKADKVSNATNGNFASLDSNGNLIDSGHKHSDYLTQHQSLTNYVQKSQTAGLLKNDGTVDTNQYLIQHQDISGKANKNEMNVVPGTGVDIDKITITLKQGMSATVLTTHQDISGKENAMPIATATGETLTAVVGNYYRLDNVGTLAITLPTIVEATKLQAITFMIACGLSALVTFAPQGSETILYQEGFALEANTIYEVTALWNGSEWTLSRVIYK